MRTIYIDFTDSGIDRVQFRQMVKTFNKIKMFSHSEGKILYFKINRDDVADAFVISCARILKDDGFLIKLISK